ncbi:hypothetical protein BVX93_00650, partial [bacterium B13(2017)]
DMIKGLRKKDQGAKGTNAEQLIRYLIVKFRYNASYGEAREMVNNNIYLRNFSKFSWFKKVPQRRALNELANKIGPQTIKALNQLLIEAAKNLNLIKGEEIRFDTTVCETNIHYPTDNRLLWDVVKTVTTMMIQLKTDKPWIGAFPNRTRRIQKLSQKIFRSAKKKTKRFKTHYREAIRVTKEVLNRASNQLEKISCTSILDMIQIEIIKDHIEIGNKIIDQAERRVFKGEKVKASEKIYSIYERHTECIVRGKAGKNVEFGRKILLTETKGGVITQYDVLKGNPKDDNLLENILKTHKDLFDVYPSKTAGDRGFYSKGNEQLLQEKNILNGIPKKGYKNKKQKEWEKSKIFKQNQKFRNGIEGRISVLKNKYGMN